jgi:hypothetical protein
MKVKIWTVTMDGDNIPVETSAFASEDAARADVVAALESRGVARCKDGHKLEAASLPELADLWEAAADGMCAIEEHELELEPIGA